MISRATMVAALALLPAATVAQTLDAATEQRIAAVMPKVVNWRRDIHQNPELSNRETRTARVVAEHLRSLGLEVQEGVAKTGVVAVLKGGRPGPVIALRADMDALPVTELTGLPFASKARTTYNGQEVGVMHACGHDMHVAILMGVAEVLAGMKDRVPGTVKFIFQPAEEGAPVGETGGAGDMVAAGVLENPKVEAVYGLHVISHYPAGEIFYRSAGAMASSDNLRIVVRGRQTHGAMPWGGVDPIVIGSQIVIGLQTIASRQVDVTLAPSIVTIGQFSGGVRGNIIPDSVIMEGTIRAFDPAMQKDIHDRIRRTATSIAQAGGATADVDIRIGNPVTYNDPALTDRMLPRLRRAAGAEKVHIAQPMTGAEDFSKYQQKVPGLFFFVGGMPANQKAESVARNHSPQAFFDEGALPAGLRALLSLVLP